MTQQCFEARPRRCGTRTMDTSEMSREDHFEHTRDPLYRIPFNHGRSHTPDRPWALFLQAKAMNTRSTPAEQPCKGLFSSCHRSV